MLITDLSQQNYIEVKIKVVDAISFTQMHQKFHYTRKHQLIYFKKDNKILLRLHKDYFISQSVDVIKVNKLKQRYMNLFEIITKVDKQVYRLDIFDY